MPLQHQPFAGDGQQLGGTASQGGPNFLTKDYPAPSIRRSRRRLFLALLYRILLIKFRRPWSTFAELLTPVLLAICLVLPRLVYPKVYFHPALWATPPNSTAAPDYSRCPFGMYGPLAMGPLTHRILETWATRVDPQFRASLLGKDGLGDALNLACSRSFISATPYLRPMYHFQRTFDGKYIGYLPFLSFYYGPVVFASHRLKGSEGAASVVTNCSALKEFFDTLYYHLNPYLYAAQEGVIPGDENTRHAFWWEAEDITGILRRPGGSARTRSLLYYTRSYIQSVSSWSDIGSPVGRPLTFHLVHPVTSNTTRVTDWVDPEMLRNVPVHTWFSCDERPVVKAGGTPDSHFGRLAFHIRMRSANGGVPDTRSFPISFDALLVPYDARPTVEYFAGDVFPGRRMVGGFLHMQSILYAYLFNATGIRPVTYPIPPGRQSAAAHNRPRSISLPAGVAMPLPSSGNPGGARTEKNDTQRWVTRRKFAEFVKSGAAAISSCNDECVDWHLDGRAFCNPACSAIYDTNKFPVPPLIRFRDARAITSLFRHCLYLPQDADGFGDCVVAAVQSGCVACSRLDIADELPAYMRAVRRAVRGGSQQNAQPDESLWSRVIRELVIELESHPNTTFAERSDILYCGAQVGLLLFIEGKVDMVSTAGRNASSVSVAMISPILDEFFDLVYDGHCSAYKTVWFTENVVLRAWQANQRLAHLNRIAHFYFASQLIANMWVSLKMNPVTETAVPIRFTESATPVPGTWFDEYIILWLQAGGWGLIWAVTFVVLLYTVIRTLMVDHNAKVKEVFKIMGAPKWILYTSTLAFYAVFLGISSILVGAVLLVQYPHASVVVLVLLNYAYGWAVVGIAFLVTSLCSSLSAATASNIGAILYVLSAVPQFTTAFASGTSRTAFMEFVLRALPPSAYAFAHTALLAWELPSMNNGEAATTRQGITLSTIRVATYEGLSIHTIIIALVIDALVFLLLGLYIDELTPGTYGIPKPFHFPFLPSYWCPSLSMRLRNRWKPLSKKIEGGGGDSTRCRKSSTLGTTTTVDWAIVDDGSVVRGVDQPAPGSPVIQGVRLRKTFTRVTTGGPWFPWCCLRREHLNAVAQCSLSVHSGEIVALLGHNGAGKTTMTSMLTGMLPPTSGKAYIRGYDMAADTSMCREYIGFCPQYDVLFSELTVEEHLRLYCAIKGVPRGTQTEDEIGSMVQKFRLHEKIKSRAATLSGGQQRSLSVAIAAVGGSTALFLDEPSTGMDPYTRRYLWDALKDLRTAGRAILLTTHFMEEADYLGDRVAIMANARIRCFGVSHFLKTVYGTGYTLAIVKRVGFGQEHQQRLFDLFPGCYLVTDAALEITLRVPSSAAHLIPGALRRLEAESEEFAASTVSLRLTTLEEVFLTINAPPSRFSSEMQTEDGGMKRSLDSRSIPPTDPTIGEGSSPSDKNPPGVAMSDVFRTAAQLARDHQPRPVQSWFVRFGVLVKKRYWITTRDPAGLFCQLLLPVAFVAIAVFVTRVVVATNAIGTPLDMSIYRDYTYRSLAPSPVLIGFGKEVHPSDSGGRNLGPHLARNTSTLNPEHAAGLLYTCLQIAGSDGSAYPQAAPASRVPTVRDFDDSLLKTWAGAHPTDPQLSRRIGSSRAKMLAYYFERHNASPDQLVAFLALLAPNIPEPLFKQFVSLMQPVTSPPPPLVEGWLFHNGTHRDAVSTGFNMLARCLLESLVGSDGPSQRLTVWNHPLPIASSLEQATLYVAMGVATIGGTWAAYAVKERVCGAKRAQHASGVSVLLYWVASAVWDFCTFFVTALVIFLVLTAFRVDDLVAMKTQGPFICLFLAFGLASIPFSYLASLSFDSPVAAQATLALVGLFLPLLASTLRVMPATAPIYRSVLQYIFMLLPPVAFLTGLSHIASLAFKAWKPIWSLSYVGLPLLYLCLEFTVYFSLLLLADWARVDTRAAMCVAEARQRWRAMGRWILQCGGCMKRRRRPSIHDEPDAVTPRRRRSSASQDAAEDEDQDVSEEREVVREIVRLRRRRAETGEAAQPLQFLLTVEGLRKVFPGSTRSAPPKVAVADLWFAVPRGQCFGFLGANGAGKTTTMTMITGGLLPTKGTACVNGQDVFFQPEARRHIGYCPQSDWCIDHLTGREHLHLYLRLALLPRDRLAASIDAIVGAVGLTEAANRPVRTYSGGNRRKLALALAVLNDPDVIFLDEPSSGVDPASRRQLWRIVQEATRLVGRSTVITSHSMEECEALCDRIGIMQDGRLLCIGTPAHLRARFGDTYQLDVTLVPLRTKQNKEAMVQYMQSYFPGASCVEQVGFHQRWKVPRETTSLAPLFESAQKLQDQGVVQYYALSETTIGQIFVDLARSHSS